MDDENILNRVRSLVDEEHGLRSRLEAGNIEPGEEQRRLREIEESLDQCWDLLPQRRARREADQNPDEARARPKGQVETYLQ